MFKMRNNSLLHKYQIIPIIGGIFLILNLFLCQNQILGLAAFFLYLIPLAYHLGKFLNPDDSSIHKFIWGFLTLFSALIVILSLTYYAYELNNLSLAMGILLPLNLLFLRGRRGESTKIIAICYRPAKKIIYFLAALAASADLGLIYFLLTKRTDTLLPSPWQMVGPWFFLTYTTTTAILFYLFLKWQNTRIITVLCMLHLFLTFSITVILYKLGFGFDAFIHRSTEEWILKNGFILPKQPYYIGQYSLVVFLAKILAVPVFFVDTLLVPALASLTLPIIFLSSANLGWRFPYKTGLAAVWLIPFVPFLSLSLTTPHNLVLLLTVTIIVATIGFLENKIHWLVITSVSLAAAVTHPLVGGPLCLFTLAALFVKKYSGISYHNSKKPLLAAGAVFASSTLLLPILFLLNNFRQGAKLPNIVNPLQKIPEFLQLFAEPYWYAKHTSFIFESLYFWERLIVPFFIIISCVGFVWHFLKYTDKRYYIFPAAACGLCASAWLLRSWIVFPDVVTYEQGDYPLRLLKTSLIFILPGAIYFLGRFFSLTKIKNNFYFFTFTLAAIGVILTLSLYFSYPQRNIKARFPGYNITVSDLKAVEWIHEQNSDNNYIVLANQLVSAAALTKYSFAKYFSLPSGEVFYYSIPTGGVLYQYYGKMIYEGQKRAYMEEAMKISGVKKSYFVINSYWGNSDKIIAEAKKTADSAENIDNGALWIFEYNQK